MVHAKRILNKFVQLLLFCVAIGLLSFILTNISAVFAAQDVKFGWDANPEKDLAGYVIHQGKETGKYTKTHVFNSLETTKTITVDDDGKYFFALTAFDTSGNESGFSDEVNLLVDTTPPGMPVEFQGIVINTNSIQMTINVE